MQNYKCPRRSYCEFKTCKCSIFHGPKPYGRCFLCKHGAVWHKLKSSNTYSTSSKSTTIYPVSINYIINIPTYCKCHEDLPA